MDVIVDQCCCGCSLQTGTKTIGWLYLIGGIISIISNVTMLLSNSGGVFQIYGAIPALVSSSITVVVTIPLLIAASKNRRPGLLLPWLILSLIQLFFWFHPATGFFFFLYYSAIVLPMDMISGIIGIVIISLTFVFGIYFWFVIYSYRQQLLLEPKTRHHFSIPNSNI